MAMSQNSLDCLIKRLCNLTNLTSFDDDTRSKNDDLLENSNFFRILLPMFIVVGVFIIIALILFMQRVLFQLLHKSGTRRVRHSRSSSSVSGSAPSSHETQRDIQTITQNYGVLPTYVQVMESITKGEEPPPYHEVASGGVNYGFSSERSSPSESNATDRHVTVDIADNSGEPPNSRKVTYAPKHPSSSTTSQQRARNGATRVETDISVFVKVPNGAVRVDSDN